MAERWWRDAVVYQVYPRSFGDGDGDGIGDLAGILDHVDHVAALGASAVWLTPFQRSPQADHGYDVSDYCDVDPLFGDLAGFDRLLARAHELRLRVVVDLVPNHCSVEHPLFGAAVAAGPGSPERDRFHIAPGRGPGGGEPPNNWPSVFGGPAWSRIAERDGRPGEWYLHMFAPEQPDWNWRNPATAAFFDQVLRFWFDRGVDGLRIDVAHGLFKAAGLPDLPDPAAVPPMQLRANPLASDQDEVHGVYRRWRALTDTYTPPRALIGEVNLEPVRAARYTRDGELHQAFAFALLSAPWDPGSWREALQQLLAQRAVGAAPVTWVVENHDVPRAPTRYGGGARGLARARAALLAVLGLPGAAYLYQGQELGLPEVDVPAPARRDPAWPRAGRSRDGCRVPLPWRRDPAGHHGFSGSAEPEPWLPVPEGWGELSVQAQTGDAASTLELCRTALALRTRLHGDGAWSADDTAVVATDADGTLVVRRGERFLLALTMGERPVELPAGRVLLASGPLSDGRIPPDTGVWIDLRGPG